MNTTENNLTKYGKPDQINVKQNKKQTSGRALETRLQCGMFPLGSMSQESADERNVKLLTQNVLESP